MPQKFDTTLLDDLKKKKDAEIRLEEEKMLDVEKAFEMDEIIRKGVDHRESFKSENGLSYVIRAVSIPESNMAMYRGLREISDTKTVKKIWKEMNGRKKEELDIEDELNLMIFTDMEDAYLVFYSLVDSQQVLKKTYLEEGEREAIRVLRRDIPDINKMAKRIKVISGLAKDSASAIESFREDVSRIGTEIRDRGTEVKTCEICSINKDSKTLSSGETKTNE